MRAARTDPATGRVFVITGSGISAESGIPTFRGKDGYWRNRDPTQLATMAAFRDDPETVWEWYRERRALIRRARPNAAHQALVRLAAHAHEFILLTQNVDDLHARAEWEQRRLPAESLVQIHGDIFLTRCTRCDFRRREPDHDVGGVPACPECSSPLRPGVVWFGEQLEPGAVRRVEAFLGRGSSDLVLVIGTTASFDYIVRWALAAGAGRGRLIEVNPEETTLSPLVTETLRAPAAVAVPRLVEDWVA